jgi:hypothetical protein
MFIHIFAFRWTAAATTELKQRAEKDIRAFQGNIPGLLESHVGTNLSPRGNGYAWGGVMKFTTRAAYQAYTTHPSHLALLHWLTPLIEPVELDFEA